MIFKRFNPNDILVTPFVAHKHWQLSSDDTSSGLNVFPGQYSNENFRLMPTVNGQNTALIHQSINSLFVREFNDNPLATMGQVNKHQERKLYENVSVISIPQGIFGEAVNKNKIQFNFALPSGQQLIQDSLFETDTILSTIPDPYTLTQTSSWFTNPTSTGSVIDGVLYLQNISPNISEIYYLIDQTSIITGEYLLALDIAGLTIANIDYLTVRIVQPSFQDTVFQININNYNTDLSAQINLSSISNALIIIRYPNPIKNIIQFNKISIIQMKDHIIIDDGYGNLCDSEYSQSASSLRQLIKPNIQGEWNFRTGYLYKNQYISNIPTEDDSVYKINGTPHNVLYEDGLYSTKASFKYVGPKQIDTFTVLLQDTSGNIFEQPVNVEMILPDSYVRIPYDNYKKLYNFRRDDNFCISGILQLFKNKLGNEPLPPGVLYFQGNGYTKLEYLGATGDIIDINYNGTHTLISLTGFLQQFEVHTGNYEIIISGDIASIFNIKIGDMNNSIVQNLHQINVDNAINLSQLLLFHTTLSGNLIINNPILESLFVESNHIENLYITSSLSNTLLEFSINNTLIQNFDLGNFNLLTYLDVSNCPLNNLIMPEGGTLIEFFANNINGYSIILDASSFSSTANLLLEFNDNNYTDNQLQNILQVLDDEYNVGYTSILSLDGSQPYGVISTLLRQSLINGGWTVSP